MHAAPACPGAGTVIFNRVAAQGWDGITRWWGGAFCEITSSVQVDHVTVYSVYARSIMVKGQGALKINNGAELNGTGSGSGRSAFTRALPIR
jgi:hypothetical protein